MSSNGSVRVTYRGSIQSAFALVECMEGAGAEVIWTPPVEQRNSSGVLHEIIIDLLVSDSEDPAESASLEIAKSGRAEFLKRFPDRGTVEIEDAQE